MPEERHWMKILLISANNERHPYPVAPIGLSIRAFQEVLLKNHLPVEYLTKDAYDDD